MAHLCCPRLTVAADGDTFDGFQFYDLDPSTATATPTGTIKRGSGESEASFYAGYHRAVDATGKMAYRFGYE